MHDWATLQTFVPIRPRSATIRGMHWSPRLKNRDGSSVYSTCSSSPMRTCPARSWNGTVNGGSWFETSFDAHPSKLSQWTRIWRWHWRWPPVCWPRTLWGTGSRRCRATFPFWDRDMTSCPIRQLWRFDPRVVVYDGGSMVDDPSINEFNGQNPLDELQVVFRRSRSKMLTIYLFISITTLAWLSTHVPSHDGVAIWLSHLDSRGKSVWSSTSGKNFRVSNSPPKRINLTRM